MKIPLTETNGGKRAFLHLKTPHEGIVNPTIASPKNDTPED